MTATEGDGINGALTKRSDDSSALMFYIDVDDIDEALAAVEAVGGKRLTERMPIPTVGWSAFFEDSERNLAPAAALAWAGSANEP